MIRQAADLRNNRRILIGIAIIPVVDCICNQLNNALHLEVGPLSALQVMRACLMFILAAILARTLVRDPSLRRRIPWPAFGAVALLSIILTRELLVSGTVQMENVATYAQLAYWILVWCTVSVLCTEPEDAELLLKGVAAGALLTALSVFVGLFVGVGNFYTTDSVKASAGWFDTPKMITGILATGGIVVLYLGRERKDWLAPILSALCFAACVITFARAGTVALGAAIAWLFLWRIFFCDTRDGRWLNRFGLLLLIGCIVVPVAVDTHSLFARWGDVDSSDRAGSGRAAFWAIAEHDYASADPAKQALGDGYEKMSEMLFREYGDDIKHTHNDVLDLLLVGGAVGGVWLATLIASFIRRALISPLDSASGAAAIAVVLVYLSHGQLTGQIWGTDAMSLYTISLTCFACIGSNLRASRSPSAALNLSRLDFVAPLGSL